MKVYLSIKVAAALVLTGQISIGEVFLVHGINGTWKSVPTYPYVVEA